MQLTRLTIENLRAIAHFDLDLSDPTGAPRRKVVLLGANGAGKTTVIDAIVHAWQSLAADEELGGRLLTASDVRSSPPSEGEASPPPRNARITIEAALSSEETRRVRSSLPDAPGHGAIGFVIGDPLFDAAGEGRTFPDDARTSFREATRVALRSPVPPGVLLPADRGALNDDATVTVPELANFAPRVGCLRKSRERFAPLPARLTVAFAGIDPTGALPRMWKALAKYFPELPRPVAGRSDQRLWFENGDGSVVPLSALSDGERAVLLLCAEIALRAPTDGIVLVDELEQHLHPAWQEAVVEGLPALMPYAQFIFATQSPYLAACAPDDVIKVGGWKRRGK